MISFTSSPHGVFAHVPAMQIDTSRMVVQLFCDLDRGPLWLVLHMDPNSPDALIPLHHCGCAHDRLVIPSPLYPTADIRWQWQDLYISPRPEYRADPLSPYTDISRLSAGLAPPFRIKPFTLAHFEEVYDWKLVSVTPTHAGWRGTPPATLTFSRRMVFESRMTITVGLCAAGAVVAVGGTSRTRPSLGDPGPHYASVRFHSFQDWCAGDDTASHPPHACPEDHIPLWQNGSRVFEGKVGPYRAGFYYDFHMKTKISFITSPFSTVGRTLELRLDYFEVRIVSSHYMAWVP